MPRLIFFLFIPIISLLAQSFSTAPAGLTKFETSELLPASAVNLCSPSTVTVTRTSGTVLTNNSAGSATAPIQVRFGQKTKAFTASSTITISSGTNSGRVNVYSYLNPTTGVATIKAYNPTGNTLTGSGVTIVTNGTQFISEKSASIPLYDWDITSGAWNATITLSNLVAKDCWIDFISLANKTASAVTVTITDGQSTPLNFLNSISLAANTTQVIYTDGGLFFDTGMKITVGTASAIDAKIRGARR